MFLKAEKDYYFIMLRCGEPGAKRDDQKHTTGGIPRWSPTLVLVARFSAYVWQSGRDAQFSLTYGRMYCLTTLNTIYYLAIFCS